MKYLSVINTILEKIYIILSGMALFVMTLIIAWQIFGRYVLNHSPAWSTSLAMLLMVYTALLMVAVGVRQRFHLRLWIGLDFLSAPYRRYLMLFNYLMVMLLGIYMFVYGIQLAILTHAQSLAILMISRSVNYLSLSLSGGGIILFSLEQFLNLINNQQASIDFLDNEEQEEIEALQHLEM